MSVEGNNSREDQNGKKDADEDQSSARFRFKVEIKSKVAR
jgi:hypothetical protein